MNKHFVNLSNGIFKLPELGEDVAFIRMQSTTIERGNWHKLFTDLDHNLLMNLALGNKCHIYDYGTNRPLSKTIYLGVPIIKYCLTRYWLDHEIPQIRYSRDGRRELNVGTYFAGIYQQVFRHRGAGLEGLAREKARYYKKFLNTEVVRLIGHSKATADDGNVALMKEILQSPKYIYNESFVSPHAR